MQGRRDMRTAGPLCGTLCPARGDEFTETCVVLHLISGSQLWARHRVNGCCGWRPARQTAGNVGAGWDSTPKMPKSVGTYQTAA